MQWLIDLVIEAIGVPPCYIDRGDPATADFTKGDFVVDGNWYAKDLSSIVPEGAQAVALRLYAKSSAANRFIMFRENGNVNEQNMSYIRTQIASLSFGCDIVVPLDADRKIETRVQAALWEAIEVTVKGWWL